MQEAEPQPWPCCLLQVVVSVGVGIASYGELNFVFFGVMLQLISIATESVRLSLVQILLQAGPRRRCHFSSIQYLLCMTWADVLTMAAEARTFP